MIGIITYNAYYGTYTAFANDERATFRTASQAEEWCYTVGALSTIIED